LRETQLAPLHEAVRGLTADGSLRRLIEIGAMRAAAACPSGAVGVDLGLRGPNSEGQEAARVSRPAHVRPKPRELKAVLDDVQASLAKSLDVLVDTTGSGGDVERAAAAFRAGVEAALRLPELSQERLCAGLMDEWAWVAIIGQLISEAIAWVAGPESARGSSLDELKLGPAVAGVFCDLGLDEGAAWDMVALMRVFRRLPLPSSVSELPAADRAPTLIRTLVTDQAVRAYLRVNIWEGVSWFNRESFGQALWWMFALDALQAAATPGLSKTRLTARLAQSRRLTAVVAQAGEVAEYQLDRLEEAARG
jgi:hypothetical protein